jgi:hypothetical protein
VAVNAREWLLTQRQGLLWTALGFAYAVLGTAYEKSTASALLSVIREAIRRAPLLSPIWLYQLVPLRQEIAAYISSIPSLDGRWTLDR